MHKKFLYLLFLISNYVSTMEKIVATHPLIKAAANNDTETISQELEKLNHGFGSAVYNLLECRNTEVALALQKSECLTFEKITYNALAAAIKNKKAEAALKLLYCGPVCLHNNPDFLLHAAAQSGWPIDTICIFSPGKQQKRVLECMIENGALVNQKHPQTGKTPAQIALETGAYWDVQTYLDVAITKYEEDEKNFKPYHREVRIPPYFDIVSYENPKTLDDERRIQHYKQHCRVDYKPT